MYHQITKPKLHYINMRLFKKIKKFESTTVNVQLNSNPNSKPPSNSSSLQFTPIKSPTQIVPLLENCNPRKRPRNFYPTSQVFKKRKLEPNCNHTLKMQNKRKMNSNDPNYVTQTHRPASPTFPPNSSPQPTQVCVFPVPASSDTRMDIDAQAETLASLPLDDPSPSTFNVSNWPVVGMLSHIIPNLGSLIPLTPNEAFGNTPHQVQTILRVDHAKPPQIKFIILELTLPIDGHFENAKFWKELRLLVIITCQHQIVHLLLSTLMTTTPFLLKWMTF